MTIEEYNKEKTALAQKHEEERNELDIKFALSNAPCIMHGDILFTKSGYIGLVEKRLVSRFGENFPKMYYKCQRLTKKLEPNKRDPLVYIYLHEIEKIKSASTGETTPFTQPELK